MERSWICGLVSVLSVQAAITKLHRLCGLKIKNLVFHWFEDSKIKELSESVSEEAFLPVG